MGRSRPKAITLKAKKKAFMKLGTKKV